jgi:RNA polymerase sigma-70 factor (ECF subfamily)
VLFVCHTVGRLCQASGSLMLEDTLLKLRFNRGDRDALRRIYEKYKDDLLKLAVALLNDISLAEDVVNDSFVTFTQCMGEIRLTGNLKSFLATCVVNHARNVYRAKQRKRTVGIDDAGHIKSDSSGPEQSAIFNEQYQQLRDVIAELPCEQREIVILHLQNGMRFRHIAKLQNISVNTAKSRYRYGLDKLRTLLNSEVEK